MKWKLLCLSFVIVLSTNALGQNINTEPINSTKQWTLQSCLEYALEQNIQLQQNRISSMESEIDVQSAKAALFPNLSFNPTFTLSPCISC